MTEILIRLPVLWRFFVKTRLFELLPGLAGRPGRGRCPRGVRRGGPAVSRNPRVMHTPSAPLAHGSTCRRAPT